MSTVAVIGAGWSGAVCARELTDRGHDVEVLERAPVVGGHSRAEVLDGVVYEPNGAHIFHTSDRRVADYVHRFGLTRPYRHCVLTEVHLDEGDDPVLLSWPPQVEELRRLPVWPTIERELDARPPEPHGADFATWVTSLMGPTLYRLFIEGYTAKQWGRPASELSSSFAPRRVDLRTDGYRGLFRDTWEHYPPEGVNSVIEAVLAPVAVTCGAAVGADDLEALAATHDAVVVTAALDDLLGRPDELAWRGVAMRSTFHPTEELDGTVTPAYVVNRPSPLVPWTRTVESKHATGQRIHGTVVSHELPGAPARHYPVPTVEGHGERRNAELADEVRARAGGAHVDFCGRLATYRYIDQDEAIADALATAEAVHVALGAGTPARGAAGGHP